MVAKKTNVKAEERLLELREELDEAYDSLVTAEEGLLQTQYELSVSASIIADRDAKLAEVALQNAAEEWTRRGQYIKSSKSKLSEAILDALNAKGKSSRRDAVEDITNRIQDVISSAMYDYKGELAYYAAKQASEEAAAKAKSFKFCLPESNEDCYEAAEPYRG